MAKNPSTKFGSTFDVLRSNVHCEADGRAAFQTNISNQLNLSTDQNSLGDFRASYTVSNIKGTGNVKKVAGSSFYVEIDGTGLIETCFGTTSQILLRGPAKLASAQGALAAVRREDGAQGCVEVARGSHNLVWARSGGGVSFESATGSIGSVVNDAPSTIIDAVGMEATVQNAGSGSVECATGLISRISNSGNMGFGTGIQISCANTGFLEHFSALTIGERTGAAPNKSEFAIYSAMDAPSYFKGSLAVEGGAGFGTMDTSLAQVSIDARDNDTALEVRGQISLPRAEVKQGRLLLEINGQSRWIHLDDSVEISALKHQVAQLQRQGTIFFLTGTVSITILFLLFLGTLLLP